MLNGGGENSNQFCGSSAGCNSIDALAISMSKCCNKPPGKTPALAAMKQLIDNEDGQLGTVDGKDQLYVAGSVIGLERTQP